MAEVKSEVLRLTEELIRFNSFTEEGKGAILQFVYDYLGDEVVEKSIYPKEESPYLVAHIQGKNRTEKGFTLILQGHLDVVPPGNMTKPFEPQIMDGKLYGRGACDMKSGCAAMLVAFKKAASDPCLQGDIYLAFTTDEEFVAQRVKEVIAEHLPAGDLALVAEPTDGCLGIAHKGTIWAEVTFSGRSAHASNPEAGVNAIYLASRFIEVLNEYNREVYPKRIHPVCGHPTLVVGCIQAGQYPNIVPDTCSIQIDQRYIPGQTENDFLADMAICFSRCKKQIPEFQGDMKLIGYHWPPISFPTDSELYLAIQKALTSIPHFTVQAKGLPYWGEGAYLGERTPTLYFGPGSIDVAHSDGEYVDLSCLEQVAAGYHAIIKQFCFKKK